MPVSSCVIFKVMFNWYLSISIFQKVRNICIKQASIRRTYWNLYSFQRDLNRMVAVVDWVVQ